MGKIEDRSEYNSAYREENKDRLKQQSKKHYSENSEYYKEKARCWKASNAVKKKILDRKYHLKHKYGITIEQYESMLESQNGLCKLCGKPEWIKANFSEDIRLLSVDHCHDTGRIRGLLCGNCNTAIGILGDTEQSIERVYKYMKGEL